MRPVWTACVGVIGLMIQGKSDLWVITCNALRLRALSCCLSDSISPTRWGAIPSLYLNCPIRSTHDAQLFLKPFPLHFVQQRVTERESYHCELIYRGPLCCSPTSTHLPWHNCHTTPVSPSPWHTQSPLHELCLSGHIFCSLTSFSATVLIWADPFTLNVTFGSEN